MVPSNFPAARAAPSSQIVQRVLRIFQFRLRLRFFLAGGFLRRRRAPPPEPRVAIMAALLEHAHQRRIDPVGDQRIHDSPPITRPSRQPAHRQPGVENRVFPVADRLLQRLDTRPANFRLGQRLRGERLDPRRIERELGLVRTRSAARDAAGGDSAAPVGTARPVLLFSGGCTPNVA